jgi:mono/diheme cytochrome c family protein
MRERIAKSVVVLALCALVALSYLFARSHNLEPPPEPRPAEPAAPPPPHLESPPDPPPVELLPAREILERGQEVYAREGCATCHSIAGTGNPRNPLDGAGDRWAPDELEAWTLGAGIAADQLPAAIIRRKQRYRALPADDLKALAAYLSTLSNRE